MKPLALLTALALAGPAPAADSLSMARLRADVEFLGSDRLKGRGTGSPGGDIAALFLARRLQRLGLRPLGDRGTFLQRIPFHGGQPLPTSRLDVITPDSVHPLRLNRDYLLYDTGDGTFIGDPAPLVFVGYGIVAPEFDYNDYQDINVEGALVVFLEGEPPSQRADFFNGPQPTRYALPALKQRIALSRGARGSIMIADSDGSWGRRAREFAFEHVTLLYDDPQRLNALLHPQRAALLFAGARHSLAEIRTLQRDHALSSFALEARLRFTGAFRQREFFASNVVGLLEGGSPLVEDEYLLLSAHYDHLGVGPPVRGDSLYNGVVDNALGCAALLEIARVLAAAPVPPRRNLLFLFVTGEEKGLLGSRHYCAHPAVPLHRTIAALNVDGMSIIDTFDDVIGIGAEYSTLGDALDAVCAAMGLKHSPIPPPFRGHSAFSSSDQLAFAQAGIPSMAVLGGFALRHLDPDRGVRAYLRWGRRRYHTPFDDLNQPINYRAVMQHCSILTALTRHLADAPLPPRWRDHSPFLNARLQTLAENR